MAEYTPPPLTLKDRLGLLLAQSADHQARRRFLDSFELLPGETEQAMINRMSRYWRHELIALDVSTTKARDAIMDNVDEETWISHFCLGAMPVILKHRLPMGSCD